MSIGFGWAAACAPTVFAQAPAASATAATFQAYPLRFAQAAEVKPQLERLSAGAAEPIEIVVDATNNRLLVRASPASQALIAQALGVLDREAPPQQNVPAIVPVDATPPVVRTYPVPVGLLEASAAEFQNRLAASGGRVAADARTGQLLVVAPEAVQRLVAGRIAELSAAATTTRIASDAANGAAAEAAALTLQHTDWETLETQLRTIYGSRLSPATVDGDGRRGLRLTTVEGAALDVVFRPATRQIELAGPAGTLAAARRLIAALDRGAGAAPQRVVPYRRNGEQALRQALAVSHRLAPAEANRRPAPAGGIPLVAGLFQAQAGGAAPPAGQAPQPQAAAPQAAPPQAAAPQAAGAQPGGGMIGPVQIEFLEGLDVLIVSGNERDVERVMQIIEDIERLSIDTQPVIEVVSLQHVASDVLAGVITQIYDSVLAPRQGKVSITALVKPNALLVIGRVESAAAVRELITKLDQPVEPSAQFAVFPLKHATAAAVQTTLQNFFAERPALGGKLQVTADVRSNSLIVRGAPRDLTEAGELIKRLDVSTGEAENELRVFTLRNALAVELAPVLQDAIAAQFGETQPQAGGLGAALQQATQPTTPGAAAPTGRSTSLRFSTIDSQGHRQLKSGILTEVRITADARGNALLVSAPAEAMELIAALIRQLDETPAAQAQIKVFTIVNGDATSLVEMLQTLFGIRSTSGTTGQGVGGLFGAAQQTPQGQNPIIQLRFSVDRRTNSIIATGGADDLNVVEAILLRLDESDVRQRQSTVYRLKNAPANDVANAINQFLRSEREVQQTNPAFISPFEQIEREVVVVPEPVSNSLIVSATPRYFDEIRKLVEDIDRRPPMVMIQVLIAEVALNNADEFGIELGVQDSILFDRSLLGDLVTITQSTQQAVPGGGTITTQNQNVVAATNTPGYAFNNAPLGNSGATSALANSDRVGAQGLSNFAVGRANADLGFGGLVLSASSESVSVLIRALQESRRLDVLSRPQVMTLDNQPAFVQVGSRVPRVQGVTINQTGQVNNVVDVNVGLILGVTPRISPDGLVVMEIDAEKSALGPEAEGVPISVSTTGEVVRQPVINTTTAQTTVSAMDGQTVVLGGLITKTRAQVHRRVPVLSSLPILGNLFRYDLDTSERTELLIIMTPHVVRNDADVARIRQIESARMSWVLGDAKRLHGNWGVGPGYDVWSDEETMVIYPDATPGEPVPVPTATEALPPEAAAVPQSSSGATLDMAPVMGSPAPMRSNSASPPSSTTSPPPEPPQQPEPPTLPPPDDSTDARLLGPPPANATELRLFGLPPARGDSASTSYDRTVVDGTPSPYAVRAVYEAPVRTPR